MKWSRSPMSSSGDVNHDTTLLLMRASAPLKSRSDIARTRSMMYVREKYSSGGTCEGNKVWFHA